MTTKSKSAAVKPNVLVARNGDRYLNGRKITGAKTLSPRDRIAAKLAAEEQERLAARAEKTARDRAWRARRRAEKLAAKQSARKAQPVTPAVHPVVAQPAPVKAQPAQQSLDLGGVSLAQAQGALAVQLASARKRANETREARDAGIAEGLRIAARILDLVR